MNAVVRSAALIALMCSSATAGEEIPLPSGSVAQDGVDEQQEQAPSAAEAALAEARARLATAKGKRDLAAAQWRKVLAHRESRLKAVQEICAQGRICSPQPLQESLGAVAVARARLADVDGNRADLLAELPKVVAHYERQVRRYQELRQRAAVAEDDANEALNEFEKELQWARKRLVALRREGDPHDRTDP